MSEERRRSFHYQIAIVAGGQMQVTAETNAILMTIPPRDLEEVDFDVLDPTELTFRAVVRYKVWESPGSEE